MSTPAPPPPAYAIGQFRDAEAEVARLREQARVAARAEEIAFAEVGFPARGSGIDVRGRTITVTSLGLGAEAFAALILAPVADTIDADLFCAERVSAVAEAIRAWPRREGAFGMMTAVLVAGTRPGGPGA